MLREMPRVIFQLDLDDANAREGDGLAVAIEPHGDVVIQIAVSESTLRGYSEEHPPSCRMEPDAAVAMAREILRQLRPDLAAKLDAAERPSLRLVGGDGPLEAA